MLTLVWNPYGFQVVDVMPCHALPCQKQRCSRPSPLSEIFSPRLLPDVERNERRLVAHANNARPLAAKVTRIFCDDNFLRIASHPPCSPDLAPSDFFLFHVWTSQKLPPRIAIRVCRWTSFGSPKISGRNQRWHFGSAFLWVSRSTNWTNALQNWRKWKVRRMKQTIVHWVKLDSAEIFWSSNIEITFIAWNFWNGLETWREGICHNWETNPFWKFSLGLCHEFSIAESHVGLWHGQEFLFPASSPGGAHWFPASSVGRVNLFRTSTSGGARYFMSRRMVARIDRVADDVDFEYHDGSSQNCHISILVGLARVFAHHSHGTRSGPTRKHKR
jgi:hypothetical protein